MAAQAGGASRPATDQQSFAEANNLSPDALGALAIMSPKSPGLSTPPPKPAIPMSEDEIKNIANIHYAHSEAQGGMMNGEASEGLFSTLEGPAPKTPTEIIAAKDDPVRQFISQYNDARGQPLSLSDAEILYRQLGEKTNEVGLKPNGSMNAKGYALTNAQDTLMDYLKNNVKSTDLMGGQSGLQAWLNGQQSWSQAMKAADLQRIQAGAQMSQNPSTSYSNQIKNLLLNKKRIANYSDDEISALESAQKTGKGESALKVIGNRLIPMVAAGIGEVSGGPLTAAVLGGGAQLMSTGARSLAETIKAQKFSQVLKTVGSNVPPVTSEANEAFLKSLQKERQ